MMQRRIFGLNQWESVKLIQYFCGALDFKHYYGIQRWRFVSNVGTKVAYLNSVVTDLKIL